MAGDSQTAGKAGKSAFSHALLLLSRRDHSAAEMDDKLNQKYGREETDNALSRLKKAGYLDDARLAAETVRKVRQGGKGAVYLRALLERRMVEREVLERTVREYEENGEKEAADSFMRKSRGRANAGALKRRGFSERAVEGLEGRDGIGGD